MPGDLRRISLLAVILLVVLRISIGWHLMYEGLWKLSTLKTSNPWSAEGYLKNATGPMRKTFRDMTGDPNDLKWLDHKLMTEKWDAWRERFLAHYPGTDQANSVSKQPVQDRLARLMDGQDSFAVELKAFPPDFDLASVAGVSKKAIRYDEKAKRLIVDGKLHLLPVERDRLIEAAEKAKPSEKDGQAPFDDFIKAVKEVAKSSSRLSFHERLTALLKQDPERVGVMLQAKPAAKGAADEAAADGDDSPSKSQPVVIGDVDKYKNYLAYYERNYAKAKTKSDWDHLEKQWIEVQQLRRELVGPVQALEQELFASAEELLSVEQLAAGPVPPVASPIRSINLRTMWGLTIFGLLLMLGLFTRLSALGGAALLSLFYLAMPPWPGVQEIPSIEHNLFVNKIFVEMVALLAIAAMPSGKWFGLDAAVSVLF
ncbi:MAG: hypothetical protein H7062_22795, partial [Candidatus Saccharimonas sp.]|nr:hypothetical protein [Planctomycetaceae bacterium]